MSNEQYLRDRDPYGYDTRAAFIRNIEGHLEDILADVKRVKYAFEDANLELERKPRLTGDELKSRLCAISNQLDDLYNELRGL